MKRILICSILAMISFISNNAYAYDIAVENADGVTIYYNFVNDSDSLEVTYNELMEDSYCGAVVIPGEVTYMNKTFKVTSIGVKAFVRCNGLLSVTLPDGITSIGEMAFYSCQNLTAVELPESLTSIGNLAFEACVSLSSIAIPNSVTRIGREGFASCHSLTSIVVPGSIKSIEEGAFQCCEGLTRVTIPESVTNIGQNAFYYCMNLTDVTIPGSVVSIKKRAFSNCHKLTSLTIPGSVRTIGECAFSFCGGLTSVTFISGVTSIGEDAFFRCTGLTSVTIPESVESIGDYAFSNCSGLKTLSILSTKAVIGKNAFDLFYDGHLESLAYQEEGHIESIVLSIVEPSGIEGKDSGQRTFSPQTFNNAVLYVPAGSVDKYRTTEGWKDFDHIASSESVSSQRPDDAYRPFIEQSKVWRTGIPNTDADGYSQLYEYRLFPYPVTVINGRLCTLLGRSLLQDYGDGDYTELDTVYVGAIYEEGRKVYCAYPDSHGLELLYDFVSPVGSDISIAGQDLTVINKEWVQDDGFKGECTCLQAKGSEQPAICWMEGVGNKSNPLESLYPAAMSNEILLFCTVGDEVLYYNEKPFLNGIGGEVKKNTIDFTHIVKTQPKAPRRDGSLSPDSSPVRAGSADEESLKGEYSVKELFVNFKPLAGPYVITICDNSGTEVYRKDVQTSNVMGLNKLIGGYAKGVYTLTVENDAEAYTAEFSIDDEVGINEVKNEMVNGKSSNKNEMVNGKSSNSKYYDLSGRQIVNSKSSNDKWNKGVYIRDGKKVVVK